MLCGTCKDSSILELADDDLSIKFVCGGGGGEKERERRKGDPREIKWRVVPKCSMFQSEWDQVRCSNGKRVIIFANSRVIEWLKAPKTGSDSIEPPIDAARSPKSETRSLSRFSTVKKSGYKFPVFLCAKHTAASARSPGAPRK